MVKNCRHPTSEDTRDHGWRILDPAKDNPESPMAGREYGKTYPVDPTALYYWRPSYWRRHE